jgi:hypothetical protein
MKIIHNVSLSVDDLRQKDFAKVGVALQQGFDSFRLEESDPRWRPIALLVEKYQLTDIVWTEFSANELDNATNLVLAPSWHYGYPMPDDDRGYLPITYDLSDYCEACGIGKRQVAPFRLKKTPKWGTKSILQLNWVFDEYFVKPDLYSSVFEPFGIQSRPVLHHRTDQELDSVVQLNIQEGVDLDIDGLPFTLCECCNRKKFLPITKGVFPAPLTPKGPLYKSNQYFGSGASAFRLILSSSLVFRTMRDRRVKGVDFKPCKRNSTNLYVKNTTGEEKL